MKPEAEKTCGSQGPAQGGTFRNALERVERLPTLPEVISRVMTMVDDPRISAQKIGEVVGQDQSMVASILKVVNSPFYGLSSRVTSIQHAVILLGFRSIRNMALSAELVKTFGESSRDHRFDRMALWRHTVATAVGARLLAEMVKSCDPEEAFLTGLIHDMGIVTLDQYFHDGFHLVLDKVIDEGIPVCTAEREVFEHDHCVVGAVLAKRWNFPPAVIEAIACHHDPMQARREPILNSIIHVADYVSRIKDMPLDDEQWGDESTGPSDHREGPEGTEPEPAAPGKPQIWETEPLDPAALEIAKLGPEELWEFRRRFQGEWRRAQIFLNI